MNDRAWRSLAERAGVPEAYVERLIALGIVRRPERGEAPAGDVRRIRLVSGLEQSGLPLEGIARAAAAGQLSLDFVEQPSYDRFAAEVDVTFGEQSVQTGIPVDLLLTVREVMGSPRPAPEDRMRETELRVVPFVAAVLGAGVSAPLIERTLRVAGDGLRRLAETEADWWRSEILQPLVQSGMPITEIGDRTAAFATELSAVSDDALAAIYHGQQAHAWLRNIFEGFEIVLAQSGLHTRLDRPPAICFFDLTGYSRLTEERGDAEAAALAGRVARLVERASGAHGGKAIKWLGDGVMLHFRDAGAAVLAALDMLDGVRRDGLPPAHIGLHAGPVLFQEGDYFGRTVNAAARIADQARQGQVLVSEAVVELTRSVGIDGITFAEIGPVELKGLVEPLTLYSAHRASA